MVQELEAQKLIIFYSLDYPINVTSISIIENTLHSIFCLKKNLEKHIINE